MRLLFIRHGDPDYEADSLTEEGFRQAAALTDYYKNEQIDYIYCSPLGRALRTAQPLSDALNKPLVIKQWLKEFHIPVNNRIEDYGKAFSRNGRRSHSPWDMYPQYLNEHDEMFDRSRWQSTSLLQDCDVLAAYKEAADGIDRILEEHGYLHDGNCFRVISGNHDTIAIVSHFGISTVLISHLLNASPYILWQGSCSTPSSVTEIVTEERQAGIASFRMLQFGSTAHLAVAGLQPSFSGRFCETFDDDQRH